MTTTTTTRASAQRKSRPGCPSCYRGWTGYRPSDGAPIPCARCRSRIYEQRQRWAARDQPQENPEDVLERVMRQRRTFGMPDDEHEQRDRT